MPPSGLQAGWSYEGLLKSVPPEQIANVTLGYVLPQEKRRDGHVMVRVKLVQ